MRCHFFPRHHIFAKSTWICRGASSCRKLRYSSTGSNSRSRGKVGCPLHQESHCFLTNDLFKRAILGLSDDTGALLSRVDNSNFNSFIWKNIVKDVGNIIASTVHRVHCYRPRLSANADALKHLFKKTNRQCPSSRPAEHSALIVWTLLSSQARRGTPEPCWLAISSMVLRTTTYALDRLCSPPVCVNSDPSRSSKA